MYHILFYKVLSNFDSQKKTKKICQIKSTILYSFHTSLEMMCPDEKSSYILFSFSFSPFSSKLNTWGIKIGQGSYEKKWRRLNIVLLCVGLIKFKKFDNYLTRVQISKGTIHRRIGPRIVLSKSSPLSIIFFLYFIASTKYSVILFYWAFL